MKLKGYTEVRYSEAEGNPLRKIRAKILQNSFNGDPADIYRAVHFLKDNDFFFANYAREFFRQIYRLLQEGKLKSVRRILVTSSHDETYSEKSQRILRFHATNSGYDYRLIAVENYNDLLAKYNLHPRIDFGIFGEKRVYRARTDQPDIIIGTWSSSKKEVERYREFFEASWASPNAFKLLEIDKEIFTIDQLFS